MMANCCVCFRGLFNINWYVRFDSLGQDRYLGDMDLEDNLFATLDQRNLEHCNCMTIDQIDNVSLTNHFSIVHLNVRSLVAHVDDVDELEITSATLGSPPVIGLCEMWLWPENELLYCLSGIFSNIELSNREIRRGSIFDGNRKYLC